MSKIVIGVSLFFALASCSDTNKQAYIAYDNANLVVAEPHPGKQLMETYCYVCHSPTASEEDRIGPPMIAIKKHYITEATSPEEFELALQKWMQNPNEADAKMFGAVRRFGVMAKIPVPEEAISEIADYMFHNEIEQPEWFAEHFRQGHGKGMRKGMRKAKNNK